MDLRHDRPERRPVVFPGGIEYPDEKGHGEGDVLPSVQFPLALPEEVSVFASEGAKVEDGPKILPGVGGASRPHKVTQAVKMSH